MYVRTLFGLVFFFLDAGPREFFIAFLSSPQLEKRPKTHTKNWTWGTHLVLDTGPANKMGDTRGGWVGQSTKKD
jgi:hypothetical protein